MKKRKPLNVYSIDLKVCATVYIKARSEREARKLLKTEWGKQIGFEVPTDDVIVSGRQFDSPMLPQTSLSPAMTSYGAWPRATFDLVESNVPESEE